ncbi:hypothetical protein OOT46_29385 [Aquabacterium sp. A7-Y]|uniref:hypothetical protein n=1 Tax=Aquabacterium sp. A7-Y TaxID=1349605 RepID=UPI00223C9555|nr:hypothetical protein [Aquabacterium sp. A7-Y]MCW7541915.1 hypothetical protein [Aquabacterium sp. A7-Y]
MTLTPDLARHGRHTRSLAALLLTLSLVQPAFAGPGAHGPNGEHLDTPAQTAGAAANGAPRLEAQSEAFELVATLSGGELSVLIDRFETNEPVLRAQLEVESEGRRATATFHADHGDYAVADPEFLKLLARPGSHPLIFTVVAGAETDLLDGTLVVADAAAGSAAMTAGHGHAHGPGAHAHEEAPHEHGSVARSTVVVGGLAALALGGLWWQRRQKRAARTQGQA